MPTASKPPDVEIAQARNLAVECLAVRQGRSNPDARHGAQDDWRSGLVSIDDELAVFHVVSERWHAAHPHTLFLGGSDLVAHTLANDLALKLGEGQQHVEREPSHAGRGVELLRD